MASKTSRKRKKHRGQNDKDLRAYGQELFDHPAKRTRVVRKNGLIVYALTDEERSTIMLGMSVAQLDMLEKYTMLAIRSRFHTERYLENTDWVFAGLHIDYGYQRSDWKSRKKSHALYCQCNRPVKYQYEIKSIRTKKSVYLGIKHFCDHLGIPLRVANEIKHGVNKINIYMDEILVAYRRGERFPQELYNRALKLGVFDSQTKKLYERCKDYQRVDLPLFHNDFNALERIVSKREGELFAEQNLNQKAVQRVRDAMNGSSHIELSTNEDEASDEKSLRRSLAEMNADFTHDGMIAQRDGQSSYSSIRSTTKLERVNEGYIKVVTSQNIVGLTGELSNRLVIQQNKLNETIAWLMDIQEFRLWQPHFIHEVIRPVNQIKYDRIGDSHSVVWMKLTEAELKIAPFRSMTRAEISAQVDIQPINTHAHINEESINQKSAGYERPKRMQPAPTVSWAFRTPETLSWKEFEASKYPSRHTQRNQRQGTKQSQKNNRRNHAVTPGIETKSAHESVVPHLDSAQAKKRLQSMEKYFDSRLLVLSSKKIKSKRIHKIRALLLKAERTIEKDPEKFEEVIAEIGQQVRKL